MAEEQAVYGQIEAHREQIDDIDRKLVALLNERADHSLAIRELKPSANMGLYDPRREEEIFSKVTDLNQGPLYHDNLREIYETILKVMKEIPSA